MSAVIPLIIAAAIAVSALVLFVTRSVAAALPVFLDLLLAVGLLRLSATAAWQAIASAAFIVVIRMLVGLGLAAGRRARTAT